MEFCKRTQMYVTNTWFTQDRGHTHVSPHLLFGTICHNICTMMTLVVNNSLTI